MKFGCSGGCIQTGEEIVDLDADTEVTLVDETHRRKSGAGERQLLLILTAGEVVTTASVEVSAATTTTTTVDELTLAQTLIEIKAAKPKVRGVMIQEPSEFTTTTIPTASKSPHDKGKTKMIESKKPLKKKDQIMYDQEVALNLQAQLQAELEEEERLARQKEEEANIALIESWDNTQAMMDADYELAARLQSQEQEELTIEEKLKLFIGLMDKSKKHFARLRVEDQRRKPPTKAQKRNQICTYLRNMVGFSHNQLKNKSFDEVQKAFDNTMSWIDSFVPMDYKVVNESEVRAEGNEKIAQESSSKGAGDDLQQESSKKQKMEDDKEREELKQQCFEIVPEEEIAIDVIPLATKPAPIVNFQIHRKGRNGYYEIMRADGSAKTYLLFSQLLKEFDKEDLENLWKVVKAKHGYTMPEEAYERVLWGDLKVMFEPQIEDEVWRNIQGHSVKLWKLYDSYGVHFVRFNNMHVYMLVKKKYYLRPPTLTDMLNKKLHADYWNEMCYRLLKLVTSSLLMFLGFRASV
ncbi:hypothetical protein Tco_1116240 [Tanacetum coccineum]